MASFKAKTHNSISAGAPPGEGEGWGWTGRNWKRAGRSNLQKHWLTRHQIIDSPSAADRRQQSCRILQACAVPPSNFYGSA